MTQLRTKFPGRIFFPGLIFFLLFWSELAAQFQQETAGEQADTLADGTQTLAACRSDAFQIDHPLSAPQGEFEQAGQPWREALRFYSAGDDGEQVHCRR